MDTNDTIRDRAKLKWRRDGDQWVAKVDHYRVIRISEWILPSGSNFIVSMGLRELGEANSIQSAKAIAQHAVEAR